MGRGRGRPSIRIRFNPACCCDRVTAELSGLPGSPHAASAPSSESPNEQAFYGTEPQPPAGGSPTSSNPRAVRHVSSSGTGPTKHKVRAGVQPRWEGGWRMTGG